MICSRCRKEANCIQVKLMDLETHMPKVRDLDTNYYLCHSCNEVWRFFLDKWMPTYQSEIRVWNEFVLKEIWGNKENPSRR